MPRTKPPLFKIVHCCNAQQTFIFKWSTSKSHGCISNNSRKQGDSGPLIIRIILPVVITLPPCCTIVVDVKSTLGEYFTDLCRINLVTSMIMTAAISHYNFTDKGSLFLLWLLNFHLQVASAQNKFGSKLVILTMVAAFTLRNPLLTFSSPSASVAASRILLTTSQRSSS